MPFLLSSAATIGLLGLILFFFRQSLRRSESLTSSACPTCGREMDRIHRNPVVKTISTLVPMRTLFCRSCKKKRYRIKPLRTVALPE